MAAETSKTFYGGPRNNLHVYAMAGAIESGMELAGEEGTLSERCYVWNDAKRWVPARLLPSGIAHGFVETMLAEDKDICIGLVLVDFPGTRIEDWHMKSEYFRTLRGSLRFANRSGVAKGLLWRHGGSVLGSAIDHMKDLFAHIRGAKDIDGLNLPIVVGELPGSQPMNSMLTSLAVDVHALDVASIEGLVAENGKTLKEGGRHTLGERYARQMLKIQKEWAKKELVRPRSEMIPCYDAHVHARTNQKGNLDSMAEWMDRNNIKYCMEHALDTRPENEEQRQTMRANFEKYKGKIFRATFIEPHEVNSVEEAVKILEREKADYAVAFGEHYGRGLMFDDPSLLRLYAACEKVGFPVMFHSDSNKNMMENTMKQLAHVLEMFPRCNLVAHAGSWWGYLPTGICDTMLQKYPNLYCDVSAAWVVLNRDRGYTREFLIRNADKILYGSDAGWWGHPDADPFFQLCDEIELPTDVKQKIYMDNAIKVYGIGLNKREKSK